jgi:prolyl oligopeptidase
VTRQVFYPSKDGTRIPMFIVHRKDLTFEEGHPLFMYAYGAYAWTAFLWYQPHIIAWLEMGGVYALPGIRGGGEYGRDWHQAGVGRNRQNAIDDYHAAAAWLIEHGYTSPDKMVANGGSASGSLAGAAVIQRPDLYAAAVIDIPTFDMLRRGGWVEEFGDPDDPDDFEVLRSYSPYHNIEPGVCYPPILVMAGEKDETAVPFHAYKFIARLQARQACDHPALLKVMWGAGHTHGATPREQAASWADAWSFLIRTLEMKPGS